MKPLVPLLAAALIAGLSACAQMPSTPAAPATPPANVVPAFDLQAHRGGRGLRPENTMPAFRHALELGVNTLELDIGVTADWAVIVAHDLYLNPVLTRNVGGEWIGGAKGPVFRTMSLKMVQAYDVGRIQPGTPYAEQFKTQQPVDRTIIPRLTDVFTMVKQAGANHVRFNIETKIDPNRPDDTLSPEVMVDTLLNVIRGNGMTSRVTIQSFDWRTLQLVQKLEPSIATVYLTIQTANTDNVKDGKWTAGFKLADHGSVPRLVKAAGGAVWSPNGGALTEALVKEAKALGLRVIPWTINNPADMERFLGWGVDGIITDYPDRLRDVLKARGLPLPTPVKVPT